MNDTALQIAECAVGWSKDRCDDHGGCPFTFSDECYCKKLEAKLAAVKQSGHHGPDVTVVSHKFREMTEDMRPQDHSLDGRGWTFKTMEHGGEYPDTMPQAIRATDAEGRSCIYVPVCVDGKVVDSLGFNVEHGT